MPGIGAPTLVSWGQVRRGTSSMLGPSQSAALSRTPAALAECCWHPPNQWSLTWRQRPKPPTHYTHPSISQPASEAAGVPAAGCHCSLVGTGFFLWALALPPCGPCTWFSHPTIPCHDGAWSSIHFIDPTIQLSDF